MCAWPLATRWTVHHTSAHQAVESFRSVRAGQLRAIPLIETAASLLARPQVSPLRHAFLDPIKVCRQDALSAHAREAPEPLGRLVERLQRIAPARGRASKCESFTSRGAQAGCRGSSRAYILSSCCLTPPCRAALAYLACGTGSDSKASRLMIASSRRMRGSGDRNTTTSLRSCCWCAATPLLCRDRDSRGSGQACAGMLVHASWCARGDSADGARMLSPRLTGGA